MNHKRIKTSVWALPLSLCLGVIAYSTLSAQEARPRTAVPEGTEARRSNLDVGALAPTAAQLEIIRSIPRLKRVLTTSELFSASVPGRPELPTPSQYVCVCGELTIDCGSLDLDACLKAAGAACGTLATK